jgi:L-asparagine transporter-like permease
MKLIEPRTQLIASLVLAGAGLSLFFGDGIELVGVSFGFIGVWLFVAAAWFFVDAVHRIPRSEAEQAIAPGEWQAWIGTAFLAAVLVAMALHRDAFAAQVPIGHNPEAGIAGRSIGTLFIAWVVLAHVLRQRWKGAVLADERDHRIEQASSGWGRGATIAAIIGIALMLGFSPTARLQQFSYPMLAQMLMATLVLGAWFDHAVAALLYWRDRRAAAA